jgi:hypothetical protein
MSESQEIAPSLDDFITELAEGAGMESGTAITMIQQNYGLDVYEVSEDDASKFVEAFEANDRETVVEVLEEYDVSEEHINRFTDQMDFIEEQSGGGDSGGSSEDSDTPAGTAETTPTGDDTPTREEVQAMIREETPDADEIAATLEDRLTGGGGGGQAQQAPQGDGNQWQKEAAVRIAQQFMQNDSGNGAAAQLGERFQTAAMNNFLKRLSRPSIGDMVEMKMYERMSDEMADEYADEFFGDPMEELTNMGEPEEDDADDSGGFWSW